MNPYDEEPMACTYCEECGDPIYYGETYYHAPTANGKFYDYCENCMSRFRQTDDIFEKECV